MQGCVRFNNIIDQTATRADFYAYAYADKRGADADNDNDNEA